MRSLLHKLTYALAFTLLVSVIAAAAQQQKPAKQRRPILTTDDVIITPAPQPSPESKDVTAKPDEPTKTPNAAEVKPAQPTTTEVKLSEEETSWRERVSQARNRAKETERAAEEGELRITQLRNDLGTSGQSPRYRNETVAELGQAGQHLTELRAKARSAAEDAAQLVEYGRQKGFTEAEGPKPTSEEGKPNEEYYRSQFAKLTGELESAQRRVQLYDNRVRDLNQQIATNSGGRDSSGRSTGGDSFYALQLQKDRDEAQKKLDEARTSQTQAQNHIYALREEARRAGVPPGLFR
jgi:chromosome segregation ATPase